MKPLSDQKEIIRLMNSGWELGRSTSSSGRSAGQSARYWLQQSGLCRGGKTVAVHASTAESMLRKGIVEINMIGEEKFWLTRFRIKSQP